MKAHPSVSWRTCLSALAMAALSGCVSVGVDQALSRTNTVAAGFTDGQLALQQSEQDRAGAQRTADEWLHQPLGQREAVQLALLNSPAVQSLVAQSWADANTAAQSGRISNPVFTFERFRMANELELGRLLSFGLLDLLSLPARGELARRRIAQVQLGLSADVVDQVTAVRQAWVRAVAAAQTLQYAQQVYDSAEASAELARRMQAAGNFNKLARARQQAFYADAATRLASASHAATSAREVLVRALGLTDEQAAALQLPARLPDLPKTARDAAEVGQAASQNRLDIQLAQASLDAAAKAQGLNLATSLTDVELGLRRDSVSDRAAGTTAIKHGFELGVRLPLFDNGSAQRQAFNAQTLAAAYRLEAAARAAGSHLRQSYSAYRTAHEIARHYRDEVIPLRQTISDENLLRYNGMLIGVFELLADSRDQIASVQGAIEAEQQFWLAEAALQAAVIGRPSQATAGLPATATASSGDTGH